MFTFNRQLDLDAEGLDMFLLPYQQDAVRHLYEEGEADSRTLWQHVNRDGAPDPKSRASVINLMNALVEEHLVDYKEQSGKGGYHRVYSVHREYPSLQGFERELVRRLLEKLAKEFKMSIGYRWLGEGPTRYLEGAKK